MKIVFTDGGTGGHFYPIIAVAEEINEIVKERKLVQPRLYYLADSPYDPRSLFENNIEFKKVLAGKMRRYFAWSNFVDWVKTFLGVISALWKIYWIYPDIIFSKGGYNSFPVLIAGKFLRIPIIIHESDSRPGRVNLWSAKFALRVAVSYAEALEYFPKEKTAVTGNPLRRELLRPIAIGAREFLKLETEPPVLLITGGSQGAAAINDVVIDLLPELVKRYQIIHQAGKNNQAAAEKRANFILETSPHKNRYKLFAYLNSAALTMAAGIAALIVSRAGSVIFEIAHWGLPAIIIPIPESVSHDQRENAFTYARSGGAVVIEQGNLTPSILLAEIDRLMMAPELRARMSAAAKKFARPDAARLIADEILKLALEHEA